MGKSSKQLQSVTVHGVEYFWEHRHGWRFDSGVGLCGASVVVCLRPTCTRELIVDFPITTFGQKGKPPNAILAHHLSAIIQSALSAGWDPESRGKAFRFDVPANA
jgi:hypothetical protein